MGAALGRGERLGQNDASGRMKASPRKRLCWVTTTPLIANAFLGAHLRELAKHYDVTLAINLNDGYPLRPVDPAVKVVDLPLQRKISPVRDVLALLALLRLVKRERYDAVHSFAPKAGLLGMLAAWLAGVPCRAHTFQGEVWAHRKGPMRKVLKAADWLTARLANRVLVVGKGERAFLEAEGVVSAGRGVVLGDGSIAGVDTLRFAPNGAARIRVRDELKVREEDFLVLCLGRLVRDKGVLDLAAAFERVCATTSNAILVFVGPDEEGIAPSVLAAAGAAAGRVRFVDYTARPEDFLAGADLVCVPSYREGFCTVVVEAAASGVPALASRIYGTEGGLVDEVTGKYLPAGDVPEWAANIVALAADSPRREQMGRAGRAYVMERFQVDRVVAEMRAFYARLLGS